MDEKIFGKALQNFTSDVAYKKAVRHLYNLGYSVEEIEKHSTYPVTKKQIEETIEEILAEQKSGKNKYEYIEETDSYGRKSFRRVEVL